MLNIFHNIEVAEARDDTNQGQFRYAVNLVVHYHTAGWSLDKHIMRTEYVIDTTENLYDCQLVAERMVKDANDRTRERRARIKFNDIGPKEVTDA